jgi:DNA sulfur modification protein DndE
VQAYIWGYPLVEMYRQRDAMTTGPAPTGTNAPIGEFGHARELIDERWKFGLYPNTDTLYSFAWLDLAKEPQVLYIPDTKRRYYVVPLCSAYNEIFASLGARTKGHGEKRYAIVGPRWKGTLPAGVEEVRAPTNLEGIYNRTLISGPEELDTVHAIQDVYTLQPLSDFTAGNAPTPPKGFPPGTPEPPHRPVPDGIAFFERLNEILKTE